MTYMAKMEGGSVVFEGEDKPKDGSVLKVETLDAYEDDRPIGQKLLDLAGMIKDGPTDASINVDHYLYGLPKR